MQGIRIAVIDDVPRDGDRLCALLRDYIPTAPILRYESAEAFLSAYEDAPADRPNLLLLDVEMKHLSGVALARRLRETGDRETEIIFTTSHTEFIGEGYEVDALHYLIKPIAREKLYPALDRAVEKLSRPVPCVIVTTADGETVRIPTADILYLEAFLHETAIHTLYTEYRTKTAFSAFLALCEEKAPGAFYRCHRSYAVALSHIRVINRRTVTVGTSALPLARGKYEEVNRAFIRYYE